MTTQQAADQSGLPELIEREEGYTTIGEELADYIVQRNASLLAALKRIQELESQLVDAQAGESMQAGHLWKAYQESGLTATMTFSGWINWNISERGKAEARVKELESGELPDLMINTRCVPSAIGGMRLIFSISPAPPEPELGSTER